MLISFAEIGKPHTALHGKPLKSKALELTDEDESSFVPRLRNFILVPIIGTFLLTGRANQGS